MWSRLLALTFGFCLLHDLLLDMGRCSLVGGQSNVVELLENIFHVGPLVDVDQFAKGYCCTFIAYGYPDDR